MQRVFRPSGGEGTVAVGKNAKIPEKNPEGIRKGNMEESKTMKEKKIWGVLKDAPFGRRPFSNVRILKGRRKKKSRKKAENRNRED